MCPACEPLMNIPVTKQPARGLPKKYGERSTSVRPRGDENVARRRKIIISYHSPAAGMIP
ncbi:hypothetical protein DMH17_02615 [Raoultella planticola]|nr:hypothetical protein [Raoultella planticola]